jgi:hypothetical protein
MADQIRKTGSFMAKQSDGQTVRVNIFTRYVEIEIVCGMIVCAPVIDVLVDAAAT